jgi:hypothetical protein
MEQLCVEIKDQYGDSLVGHVVTSGGRSFIDVREVSGKAVEIELMPDDLRKLRDWCEAVLTEVHSE